MNRKLEDSLGKLTMLLVFGYLCFRQIETLVAMIIHRDEIEMWPLRVTSLFFSTMFLFLILYFTVTRLPPRNSASGLEPRITAIAGTFVMMLLILVPMAEISAELQFFSALLVIVGTVLSVLCIRQLGRSFSIMATARELVTEGPYKLIRHPLYGAELVTMIGLVIVRWSPAAVILGLVWLAFQVRRAQHEERILRETFPEYNDYARRVPMLLPRFLPPKLGRV